MIATTTAVVEPGGVLGELACAPPLTLRQVRGDVPGRCELRLISTAAGPLAGDKLFLSLRLLRGARAAIRAAGASVAQGRAGGSAQQAATLTIRAELADGADLVADPGALIVCQGSRVDLQVEIALGRDTAIEWRELIVLGRSGERAGAATVRWSVTRLGQPVLRQLVGLSDPLLTGWAGLTAHRRVIASALIAAPAGRPRTIVASPTAVAQRVDDQTVLVTVLGDDAAATARQLDSLCAAAVPAGGHNRR